MVVTTPSSASTVLGPASAARRAAERRAGRGISRRLRRAASAIGGFYLITGGINVGLAVARPHIYDPFADRALFDWVRAAWRTTFATHPAPWAGALAAGEVLVGVALLSGGRWALAGYAAVVAFHLALMCFGFGFWMWSVPVLAAIVPIGLAYWRSYRSVG